MTQQKKKKKENQEKTGIRILGVLENCSSIYVCQGLGAGLGAGKYVQQVKGLSLVPINWDTLIPRKLKMEAWPKDTTKKEEERKSRKKENWV